MGIKGIYAELGQGQRVSLAKLAAEKLEETGRPLRLAIDISIWQFQVQAAKGGSNPAIRTLFYRVARLLSLAIEPIFVFDGPRKPTFKRNKRSTQGDRTSTALSRSLIKLFGLRTHDAPGEAEAECALLQRHGIVDAVLSEDVDTIMFGCTKTLRNWTSEGTKGGTPTHVSLYDVDHDEFRRSGLDREGMVLVALMSGGDYLPEGIPGCGPKVACAAARAGFGKSLCKLKRSDEAGLQEWRETLVTELRTNASGYFRTRHKAMEIPESFPNLEVLRYYTHPVVSEASTIDKLKAESEWSQSIDMVAMRGFVEDMFDWSYRIGADKLIRVLAPSLLVQKLLERYRSGRTDCSLEVAEQEESALIQKISGRRSHFSTGSTPEFRVHFIPADIARLDLSIETEEVVTFARDGLALNSDDDFENAEAAEAAMAAMAAKKRFDPTQPDAMWIPELILKLGSPLKVEDFEAAERTKLARKAAPKKTATTTRQSKKPAALNPEPTKTLDSWVRLTKATAPASQVEDKPARNRSSSPKKSSPPATGAPKQPRARSTAKPGVPSWQTAAPVAHGAPPKSKPAKPRGPPASQQTNPWTLSSSQAPAPRISKPATTPREQERGKLPDDEPILLSSSPPPSPAGAAAVGGPRVSTAPAPAPAPETASPTAWATPRLRLPSDPLDTPPWLKALCEEDTREREGEKQRKAAAAAKTKQATLDTFFPSPTRAKSTDKSGAVELSPKGDSRRTASWISKSKISKTSSGASRTLFPILKKGVPPSSSNTSSCEKEPPAKARRGPKSTAAVQMFLETFSSSEDEDDYIRSGRTTNGIQEKEVSIIDLTGDD